MVGTSQTPLMCIAALPEVKRAIEAGYSVLAGVQPLFTHFCISASAVVALARLSPSRNLPSLRNSPPCWLSSV